MLIKVKGNKKLLSSLSHHKSFRIWRKEGGWQTPEAESHTEREWTEKNREDQKPEGDRNVKKKKHTKSKAHKFNLLQKLCVRRDSNFKCLVYI